MWPKKCITRSKMHVWIAIAVVHVCCQHQVTSSILRNCLTVVFFNWIHVSLPFSPFHFSQIARPPAMILQFISVWIVVFATLSQNYFGLFMNIKISWIMNATSNSAVNWIMLVILQCVQQMFFCPKVPITFGFALGRFIIHEYLVSSYRVFFFSGAGFVVQCILIHSFL